MREGFGLQVADRELDHGVLAVLSLDQLERLATVGDEWSAANPQPPSGLGPEKDLTRKTALRAPPQTTSPFASKPARVQASLEMARLGIEPRTPRFSGTGNWARNSHESPANRPVAGRALSGAIPVVSGSFEGVKDVAGRPRPFRLEPD